MKWATAYLREHFFGRIRTASQCEGIHSLLKNYVDSKTSLLEFMHKFSEVLRYYRNNHLTADFETFYKFPVLTTCLESFEKQAAELYTRNIFILVKDEIEVAGALNVTKCPNSGNIIEYNTTDYRKISGELLKLISKVQNKSDAQARLSPTSALIGDPAVVKSKGDPRKVPKGQKRRRCSHCKSSRHFVRTCPLLAKEDSPVEYSNAKDEPMTEEITLTQETLKDKTNTSGIEVTEVPDASTTKIPKLSQYPMHHYPVVLPYQPYGGVLPIPLHPVPNGMAYFNQYPSTAVITSYPQFSHVSSYSSGPSDSNTWAGLLNDAVDDKQNKAITAASNELAKRKSDLEEKLKLSHDLKVAVLYFHDKFTWVKGLGLCTILFGVSLFNWYKYLKIQKGHFGEGEVEVLHTTDSTGKYVILEEMD
ncbi:hypothetical protein Ahy_B02g060152 [Arachis hypogaea]|uniref:Protein FAR1-RELATED SEQUENCE n=1 Tax=Arachis hypogaea TaxID=3818 RepID=A0A445AHW3_ARAHY|nr:hypothetical protein Ahy_B02g060152 [Arachis hypogaea]